MAAIIPVSIPVRVLGFLELFAILGLSRLVRVSIPVRVLGFLEPAKSEAQDADLRVSIPVRVLGFLERVALTLILTAQPVSIPVRVLGFLEHHSVIQNPEEYQRFNPCKGFGVFGTNESYCAVDRGSPFQSL